eukprot:SM000162S02400  [mRNA]  locus=s162:230209:231004:- [translate_table: standard]
MSAGFDGSSGGGGGGGEHLRRSSRDVLLLEALRIACRRLFGLPLPAGTGAAEPAARGNYVPLDAFGLKSTSEGQTEFSYQFARAREAKRQGGHTPSVPKFGAQWGDGDKGEPLREDAHKEAGDARPCPPRSPKKSFFRCFGAPQAV